ncbi:hypothetical protein [Argonema antarcticum]|uniref:hypothetical protein n=1 Tax=Argonema antarcticum TaxID=2942763 RepID=UPI002012E171|nr:hypothetical protein [Argonema antarcticum]MCL1471507.1 hypothetical protein [Argonema antarcticum A004/B2]
MKDRELCDRDNILKQNKKYPTTSCRISCGMGVPPVLVQGGRNNQPGKKYLNA